MQTTKWVSTDHAKAPELVCWTPSAELEHTHTKCCKLVHVQSAIGSVAHAGAPTAAPTNVQEDLTMKCRHAVTPVPIMLRHHGWRAEEAILNKKKDSKT